MDFKKLANILVKFGVTMFYMSFGSIIGGILGWYSITVPAVIFLVGLLALYAGCEIIDNMPE